MTSMGRPPSTATGMAEFAPVQGRGQAGGVPGGVGAGGLDAADR